MGIIIIIFFNIWFLYVITLLPDLPSYSNVNKLLSFIIAWRVTDLHFQIQNLHPPSATPPPLKDPEGPRVLVFKKLDSYRLIIHILL